MNRLESLNDPEASLRAGMRGALAETWTAMPAVIVDFDPVAMTCSAQPAIRARVTAPSGGQQHMPLPLLLDCPVYFPSGGNCTLTFRSSPATNAWWCSPRAASTPGGSRAACRTRRKCACTTCPTASSSWGALAAARAAVGQHRRHRAAQRRRLDLSATGSCQPEGEDRGAGRFRGRGAGVRVLGSGAGQGLLSYVAGLVGSGGQGSARASPARST